MPFDGAAISPLTRALIDGQARIEAGWCQGVMRSRNAVCMIGALDGERESAAMTLLRAISALGYQVPMHRDDACRAIADWQDDPVRTIDEVHTVYTRAIALSFRI